MIRRTLLVACVFVLVWAGPAAAQSYSDVLGQGQTRPVAVDTGPAVQGGGVGSAKASTGGSGGSLARTGSDIVVPLAQGAVALIGFGSLLALAARRRRAPGHAATA